MPLFVGHKDFDLTYLEEAYTSEHWLVRIYRYSSTELNACCWCQSDLMGASAMTTTGHLKQPKTQAISKFDKDVKHPMWPLSLLRAWTCRCMAQRTLDV